MNPWNLCCPSSEDVGNDDGGQNILSPLPKDECDLGDIEDILGLIEEIAGPIFSQFSDTAASSTDGQLFVTSSMKAFPSLEENPAERCQKRRRNGDVGSSPSGLVEVSSGEESAAESSSKRRRDDFDPTGPDPLAGESSSIGTWPDESDSEAELP